MVTGKQEICEVTMLPSTNFRLFKKHVPVGNKCSKYSGARHLTRNIFSLKSPLDQETGITSSLERLATGLNGPGIGSLCGQGVPCSSKPSPMPTQLSFQLVPGPFPWVKTAGAQRW